MGTIKNIILQILHTIWTLPQTIVGLIILPFLGKKKFIRKHGCCYIYECENMSGGISLGTFIFVSPSSAKKEAIIEHEIGHYYQSLYLSWLYLIIIGIPSCLWSCFCNDTCYYSFYTERWANKIMGLKVKHNQYNCYLYIPADKEKYY